MEAEVQDLISRARSSLAMFVAVLPPNPEVEVVSLNGKFPSWVRSKDRRLLESSAGEIKANVVVAQDGTGDFFTVAEALATVPNKSKKRYIIHVKNGTYFEKLEIGKKQKNVMLVGDSMDLTIITGNVSVTKETGTFHTATVGMDLLFFRKENFVHLLGLLKLNLLIMGFCSGGWGWVHSPRYLV